MWKEETRVIESGREMRGQENVENVSTCACECACLREVGKRGVRSGGIVACASELVCVCLGRGVLGTVGVHCPWESKRTVFWCVFVHVFLTAVPPVFTVILCTSKAKSVSRYVSDVGERR